MKDWDDLRYFLAVARAGSLQGAARALGVNHSTVFRRIHALETRLNSRLFERLPEGYRLNEHGHRLAHEADRAETAILDAERLLAGGDERLSGPVRITCPANIAECFLPSLLADFTRRYPDIRPEISVSDSDYDLRRREADLALRATREPPPDLVGRQVLSLHWRACAPASFAPASLTTATHPEALAHLPLIGADPPLRDLPVFRWQRRHFRQRIVITANSLNVMRQLAAAGLGVALLPIDQPLDTGPNPNLRALFPVCPEATAGLWLLSHPDIARSPKVSRLMQHLFTGLRTHPLLAAQLAQ